MEKINILSLLDKIKAIAVEGLSFTKNKYDQERYEKLIEIASKKYSSILKFPQKEIIKKMKKELGCITPKLGVDVAITNNKKEILILKRSDNNKWGFVGGWVDLGESPIKTAIREAKEEAGLEIEPLGYMAITNKGPEEYPGIFHQVNFLISTKTIKNHATTKLSHEHSEFKWIKNGKGIKWEAGHKKLFELTKKLLTAKKIIHHC